MSGMECGEAREALALRHAEALEESRRDALVEHLESCPACRRESAVIGALRSTRPEPAPDLAERIVRALAEVPAPRTVRTAQRPAWALAAAAVAVLALGIGVGLEDRPGGVDIPVGAGETAGVLGSELWLSEDGVVAGGLTFDDLTDEELEALLDELGPAGPGGQA